jgi:hypothetical protein
MFDEPVNHEDLGTPTKWTNESSKKPASAEVTAADPNISKAPENDSLAKSHFVLTKPTTIDPLLVQMLNVFRQKIPLAYKTDSL